MSDSYRKKMKIDDEEHLLELLDTAGHEEFQALREMYMKAGEIFIFCYSITSKDSFEEVKLKKNLFKIKKFNFTNKKKKVKTLYDDTLLTNNTDKLICILVGCKCDLEIERDVTPTEAKEFAESKGIPFLECSSKNNINVENIFVSMARERRKVIPFQTKKEKESCVIL